MTDDPPKTTRRGRAIDLFCGAGGLGYGMEQGGFDIEVATDLDETNCRTHRFNFSYGRSVNADATTLTGDHLRSRMRQPDEVDVLTMGKLAEPPPLTLVTGGPPCTGFSHIGRRNVADARNDLVEHFIRITGELQPRYGLMENVVGMTTGAFAPMLDRIIDRFHRVGYSVVTPIRMLDARDFGVPQARERVFVLAYRHGERAPCYPEATHARGNDLMQPRTPTPAEALSGLPMADDHPELFERDWTKVDAWPDVDGPYAHEMRGLSQDPDDLSYRRTWDPRIMTCSRLTAHSPETTARYARLAPGERDPSHRLSRIDADRHCLTLRAGTPSDRGGHTAARPIHPWRPRVITVREGCRMHSIPDSYRLHGSPWRGFRMLGNSVPPLLARAIAHKIRLAAGLSPAQPTVALPPGEEHLVRPRTARRTAA